MTISNSTRALAATAFIALLAGCSGGSQLSPTGTPGQAASSAHRSTKSGHVAQLFASKQANELVAQRGRPVMNLSNRGFSPLKKSKGSMVFASDNITGNVDVYDGSTGAMISQCAGCGGWGVATARKGDKLAIGTFDNTVTTWTISGSSITQTGTCTLSGGGEGADGVAWASNGGLYADNFPTNGVDEFSKASVAAGCGAPTKTVYTTNLEVVYYLATAKKTLLGEGYTSDLDVDLVSINAKTGSDTILQNNGNLSEGTGFPGGIDASSNQTVAVNNQYGSITTYSGGGSGSETGSCSWGFDPNDYTGIAFNAAQNGIWGANINFGGSPLVTYGEEDALPTSGACSVQLDTSPTQANEEYLGIAVAPRGKT